MGDEQNAGDDTSPQNAKERDVEKEGELRAFEVREEESRPCDAKKLPQLVVEYSISIIVLLGFRTKPELVISATPPLNTRIEVKNLPAIAPAASLTGKAVVRSKIP